MLLHHLRTLFNNISVTVLPKQKVSSKEKTFKRGLAKKVSQLNIQYWLQSILPNVGLMKQRMVSRMHRNSTLDPLFLWDFTRTFLSHKLKKWIRSQVREKGCQRIWQIRYYWTSKSWACRMWRYLRCSIWGDRVMKAFGFINRMELVMDQHTTTNVMDL